MVAYCTLDNYKEEEMNKTKNNRHNNSLMPAYLIKKFIS
jgi:hypothetical protein